MKKRLLSFLTSCLLLISSVTSASFCAYATSVSQSQAVSWSNSQIGKTLDYDGAYGAQCVDLIYYYYQYLGVSPQGGNANNYINNSLPSGWTRVYSGYRAGDIAVWKTNLSYQNGVSTISTTSYGHIGIIESADSTGMNAIEQNDYRDPSHVKKNWHYLSELACAIRPNFSSSVSITFSNLSTTSIQSNGATLNFNTNNPSTVTISNFGFQIKRKGASGWQFTHKESYSTNAANPKTFYVVGPGKEANYTLSAGTTYEWRPYAIYNGTYYYGSVASFTTSGSHTHSYTKKVIKASFDKAGVVENVCSCGYITIVKSIQQIKSAKLSKTKFTYDGNVKSPTLTVEDTAGKTLVDGTDYIVSTPSGRKSVGKYTYEITFKGNYSGTKSLSFTIVPKGTSISSLLAVSKGFTVKWKKQATQTTGYQIQIATDSKFTKNTKSYTVAKNSTVSKKITKLTGKKKYYVRIRTYKTVNGTKYYSAWSGSKTITTKK